MNTRRGEKLKSKVLAH